MTYEVELPDGTVVEGIPDEMSHADAKAYILKRRPDLAGNAPTAKPGIVNEAKRGLEQFLSSSGTGIAAAGGQEAANTAATRGVAAQQDIARRRGEAPMEAVSRVYDKEGFFPAAGQFVRDMPRALAGQLPHMGAAIAGGRAGAMAGTAVGGPYGALIGAALGAGATMLPGFVGSNLEAQRQAGEAGDVDRGSALAAGAGQTALEVGGGALVLGKRLVSKMLGLSEKVLAEQPAKVAAKMAVEAKRSLAGAAGRGAVRGVGVEVPVEVAQQIMERAQAGLSLTDDEAMADYGQQALGALQVAPGMGAVGGVSSRSGARQNVAAMDAQTRAQAAQEAATAAAQEQAAHAEKLKDPAYLQSVEQDYKATEAQWRAMVGPRPAKGASPADFALYKDQQQTAQAFFAENVKPKLDAYNEARKAQPVVEAPAAAAPAAEPGVPGTQDGLFPPGAEGAAAPWQNLQGSITSPNQDPAAPGPDPVEAYATAEQQVRSLEALKEQQRDAVVQAGKAGDVAALAQATRLFRQTETVLAQATETFKGMSKPAGPATAAQLKRAQTALDKALSDGDVDAIERLMPKVAQLKASGATQDEALTPTNMANVAAADQRVADEIATGREQAAGKTAALDKEKASLQAIADKVKAGPELDYRKERRRVQLDKREPADTSRTDQQTLFETPAMTMAQTGAGDVSTKSRAELNADLQIARAAGDKQAAADAIEGLRDLKARDAQRAAAPDDTSAAPTGAAAVAGDLAGTKMPPTVARRQAAGDAKALSFAKLVNVISRTNRGTAKAEELNTARNGVITNLFREIEAATNQPISAADRTSIQRQAHMLLDELRERFGDTRNLVSVGTKENPAFESPQNFRGAYRQDMQEGPNVESAPAGARTFGSPYAAAQSIMEGLNSIRNAAINNRPLPGTNAERTLTQTRTTPAALVTAVEKARANPALDPDASTLLSQIEGNLPAINADEGRREAIAAWLHRAGTGKIDPKDTADIAQALDDLERGGRSDQEVIKGKVKSVRQEDMFPDPVQGDIFKTRGEFDKFLASAALHKLRKSAGLVRETVSRAFKRTAPMRARMKDLEQQRETLTSLLKTQITVRDENVAAARTRLASAERALKAKTARLDAELHGLQAEYGKALLAFEFAAKNSQEISEKIAHNVLAFGGAPSMAKVAQDVHAAKKAYAEAVGSQDLNFDTRMRLSRGIVTALEAHTREVNKAATVDKNVKAFLEQDLNLQMQLADEIQEMADTRPFMEEARAALNSAHREQQARPDVKAAPTRLANAKKNEIAAVKAGDEVIGDVNFELSLIDKELNQIAKDVKAQMAAAGAAKIDPTAARDVQAAEQDVAGRARIAAAQKRAETLGALPGRVVTFEAKRAALGTLEDLPAKIAEADAKAADTDAEVTTRHKAKRTADALRQQATLTAGVLSEDPETVAETLQALNIRLEQLVAKRDHQRQLANEEGIAPALRATRRKEVRKTQTALATMAKLASGFSGRAEVRELLTPQQRADLREDEDIFDTFNNAIMVGTGGTDVLPARRPGPLVRPTTVSGTTRTGVKETAAARKVSPRNTITQAGARRAPTAKQAVRAANADTAHARALQEISKLDEQISDMEELQVGMEESGGLDTEVADLQTQIDALTERRDAAQAYADTLAPAGKRNIDLGDAYANEFSDRPGTDITDAAALDAIDDGRTLDVLDHLAKNGSSELVRSVASKLRPLLLRTKLRVQPGLTFKGEPVAALYVPETNTVLVDPRAKTEEDLLHEFTHAATMRALLAPANEITADQRAAIQSLQNLMQSLKANPAFQGEYAFRDLKEFVAEIYSNPALQAKLDAIGKPTTLWQRVLEFVKRILGMGPNDPKGRAFKAIDRILMPSRPIKNVAATPAAAPARVSTTGAIAEMAERNIAKPPSIRDFFANNLGLAFETAVVDMRAAPIKALQQGDADVAENASYFIRKADARMAHVYAALTEGPMQLVKDSQGNHIVQAGGGPSAQELFQAVGRVPGLSDHDKARTVQVYLTARRAQRVGVQSLDLGATKQSDIDAVMAQVKADPALKAALDDVQQIYNAYNKGLINFLADTGAIPKKEAARLLAHDDYVPYYRVTNGGIAQLVFDETNVLNVGNLRYQPYLQALKAGDQKLLPFNEAVVRNTMLLTDMGMRNMASKETAYAMQALGAIPGQKNTMRIERGDGPANAHAIRFHQEPDPNTPEDTGRRHLVVNTEGTVAESIPSEMIARGMEGSHVTLPAFMKAAGWFGDVLRAGVTRNPAYVARQLFRDPFAAALTGGLERGPLVAMAKSMASFGQQSIDGPSATSRELIRKGVVQSGIFTGDPDDLAKFSLQLAGGDRGAIKKLFALADRAAMRADSVTREQVYEDVIARGGSERAAELAAIEMMNFHKRGLSPTVQYASRLIPFFNAQIQGLNVLYKAATGQMSAEARLQIREKFFNRAMMMTAMSLAYAMAMEDDETYKNARPRDRYNNFFVPLGEGNTLKLPIPFEIGLLFKALPEMMWDGAKDKFGDEELKSARDLFLQQIPGLSSAFLPAAVKSSLEVRFNKNLFTDRAIETPAMENVAPQERFTAYTSEFAKAFSSVLQNAPADFLRLSPVQIEHLIRGHLGSLPLMVASLTNEIFGSSVERPLRKISETPIVGTFFQERYGGGATDALYAKIKAVNEAHATVKKMEAAGRRADAKAYREDVLNLLQLPDLNGAEGKLRNIAKQDKAIRASNLPAEQKRARLDHLDAQREALSRRYMDAINRIAR
jgi:hypothetical protein